MTSTYFIAPLPLPISGASAPYRTTAELLAEEVEQRRRLEQHERLLASVSVDPEVCTHPEAMHDEASNSCASCGVYYRARIAPMAENALGFSGGHHHTFSSATASAAARKKRAAATAAAGLTASRRRATLTDDTPSSEIFSQLRGNFTPGVIPMIDAIPKFVSPAPASKTFGGNAEPKRATFVQDFATLAFLPDGEDSGIVPLIASGAYQMADRESCPTAAALVMSGISALQISEAVIKNVFRVVFENPSYFGKPQRRRVQLHHLSVFAALMASHAQVVHGAGFSAGVPCFALSGDGAEESVEDCFELARVRAREKPSQSRFVKRALPVAVAARIGVTSTCVTRLVQEAYDLAFQK